MITWQDFEKVEMRVGTILEIQDFPKANKPAYQLTIDFGLELGIKKRLPKLQSVTLKKYYLANRLLQLSIFQKSKLLIL